MVFGFAEIEAVGDIEGVGGLDPSGSLESPPEPLQPVKNKIIEQKNRNFDDVNGRFKNLELDSIEHL